jgi:hypothetical protein
VGGPAIEQHPLTVIAKVRAGERDALVQRLTASDAEVRARLAKVTTLHFGRFVVFDGAAGATLFALECNHDGDQREHLAELKRFVGDDLDAFFGHCEGYTAGHFESFAASQSVTPRAFYIGHGGLSVGQILHDEQVRVAIQEWLDQTDAAGELSGCTPCRIASGLKEHLENRGLAVGPVDRGLPAKPWAPLSLYVLMPGVIAIGVVLALVSRFAYEPRDDQADEKSPPPLLRDQDPTVDALVGAEDLQPQNGLTHVVPVKPGTFRQAVLRFALWFVEQARLRVCYEGHLGGISSIHFARWSLLKDGTLVFFSNYDGSWESYLGDFIDKAHIFLTAIWTNTKWFPKTSFLVLQGASNERAFKSWARTFQRPNQIWYSAYSHLTVANILKNAKVRELAGRPMIDEQEACEWLALL